MAGTKIGYDHNGKILSKMPCARQQGTTVTLTNLFSTLPVRHKEFLRNLKKEFVKLAHVLDGYCLISCGVRITCTNVMGKGKKMTVVSTTGGDHIRDNITCVFGAKQVQSLIPFKQIKPLEEECNEYNINDSQLSLYQVTGFISKTDHGLGRSTADRQFFYINKRPCDLVKVSRVVNEVYHMFNRHQYPFVMLDISLQRDSVDVNVTPDKRQVFMQEEKLLLAIIKSSLKSMFDTGTSSYEVNQKPLNTLDFSVLRKIEQNTESDVVQNSPRSLSPKCLPSLKGFKRSFSSIASQSDVSRQPKQAKLTIFNEEKSSSICNRKSDSSASDSVCEKSSSTSSHKVCEKVPERINNCEDDSKSLVILDNEGQISRQNKEVEQNSYVEEPTRTCETPGSKNDLIDLSQELKADNNSLLKIQTIIEDGGSKSHEQTSTVPSIPIEQRDLKKIVKRERKTLYIDFNMKKIQKTRNLMKIKQNLETTARLFRAKIAPNNNAAAEEELTKNITKESFAKMEILGQFNLGFILTKLGNDLFIIDQHASDEKYNFECQQRNTSLKSQRLIVPKDMELTAASESVLLDNIEIFNKNGFEFEINENAMATKKARLISVPVSKNWIFGVEDVEELLFMLSDSPGVMCRPTRVRKMFASRACRMSIMVGTALSREEMRKVIQHMGEMEHPWNCPHGRPTMRHVINLDMIARVADDY